MELYNEVIQKTPFSAETSFVVTKNEPITNYEKLYLLESHIANTSLGAQQVGVLAHLYSKRSTHNL